MTRIEQEDHEMILEKLRGFFGFLNVDTLRKAWKQEWTPIALAVAGVLLLLLIISMVRRGSVRRRRRRAMRMDIGYDPRSIPSGVAGLAFQFFLCGTAVAASFFDRD